MYMPFFIIDTQPRALQCPGGFRPLKVLTGKESIHQWVVASKQAAAASPEVRGCMFDVTSKVEVASLLRPHTARASILACKSLRKKCNYANLVCLSCYCKSSRKAYYTHTTVWDIKSNLKYTAFPSSFSLKHT